MNAELQKYSRHKLAELNRRLPRLIRAEAQCNVKFVQKRKKEGGLKICTLTLELPKETLKTQETTQHMYAALDIVVANMLEQLRDYKLQHHRRGLRSRRPKPASGSAGNDRLD